MSRRKSKGAIRRTARVPEKRTPSRARKTRWVGVLAGFALLAGALAAGILVVQRRGGVERENAGSPTKFAGVPDIDLSQMQPRVAERVRAARDVVAKLPTSPKAWGQLGLVCDAHGLYACAEQCYARAHQLAPGEARWNYLRAIVKLARGADLDEIIGMLRESTRRMPDFAPGFYRLGQALSEKARFDEAQKAFERAIQLDAGMAIAMRRLGQVRLALGDTEGAVEWLERAAAIVPNDGPAQGSLALAYARLGDREKADRAAAESRRGEPTISLSDPIYEEMTAYAASSDAAYARAESMMARGDAAHAIPELKLLADTNPDDPLRHLDLATAHLVAGDIALAQACYDEAIRRKAKLQRIGAELSPVERTLDELDESLARFWVKYLQFFTARGDAEQLAEALSAFERGITGLPLSAQVHLAWGNALMLRSRAEAALTHYREAARLEPQQADAHYNAGFACETLGRPEEAVAHYERSTAITPDGPAARRLEQLGVAPTGRKDDEGEPISDLRRR